MPTLPPARTPFDGRESHQAREIAESFGSEADRYDRARPRYPDALVDRIVAGAPRSGRNPGILDVGCGTGIVARQFQAVGCRVLGVDPDARMADLARRHGLEVEVCAFEAWDSAGRAFDAVVSGQAWHWVDPVTGAAMAARVLHPGGRLAVFWNAFQPPSGLAEAFAAVYRRVVPDLPLFRGGAGHGGPDAYRGPCAKAADGMRQAGAFGEPEQWRFDWDRRYTRDEWLDQLPTSGFWAQIPAAGQREILAGIGAAVDTAGGSFMMHYATVAVTAARASVALPDGPVRRGGQNVMKPRIQCVLAQWNPGFSASGSGPPLPLGNPVPATRTRNKKYGILTPAIAGTGKNGEMPELPEVETARRLIADEALGRRITDVDDSDTFVCRPHSPGELRAALTGRTLTAARRRGKTMWCETSEDGPDLGIHLGMGGRIVVSSGDGHAAEGGGPRRRDAQPRKPEWDRFTLGFADGGSLVLFDKRRLGRVRLNPGFDALGPDAAEVTPADFRSLITRGSVAVKARLLDQSRIAGVGNLLADEILWQAGVHPAARTDTLGPADADRLYRALESALGSAIARGGVHTGDVIAARHPGGSCPRCGAEMRHGTVGGRSTWWCSREQVPATVR